MGHAPPTHPMVERSGRLGMGRESCVENKLNLVPSHSMYKTCLSIILEFAWVIITPM